MKTERMADVRLAEITAHYGADPSLAETVQMADEVQRLRLQLTASESLLKEWYAGLVVQRETGRNEQRMNVETRMFDLAKELSK